MKQTLNLISALCLGLMMISSCQKSSTRTVEAGTLTKKSETATVPHHMEEDVAPVIVPIDVEEENIVDDTGIMLSAPAGNSAIETIDIAPVEIHTVEISSSKSITRMACISSGTEKYSYTSPSSIVISGTSARDMEVGAPRSEYKSVPVAPLAPSTNAALAGKLTAGEINDFQKWKMWTDISENELKAYREIWTIDPSQRYSVLIQNTQGSPMVDCMVELIAKDGLVSWKARTDNTGKAELWNKMDMKKDEKKPDFIRITHSDQTYRIERPKTIDKGINTFKIQSACEIPDDLDILFTVDATGSMGDEIAYLQAELVDVISKVKDQHKDVSLRLGSVFYRDHGDTYVTQKTSFNKDINVTNEFIARQYADGGGDGPEALDDALAVSIDDMAWSDHARARLMFIVLDAPPHADDTNLVKMKACMIKAAQKGVRIIPLVASGGGYDVDKSLEYLMRCCALATNGTYAFLTDHSGIGDGHTAPSTDKYDVETLNTLLLRVINQFVFVPDCNTQQFVLEQETTDTTSVGTSIPADSLSSDSTAMHAPEPAQEITVLKCFPNPASDYVWVEANDQVKELFLADNSGKIMERFVVNAGRFQIDLTNYPTGIYHLKAWINERWSSVRIVVARQ